MSARSWARALLGQTAPATRRLRSIAFDAEPLVIGRGGFGTVYRSAIGGCYGATAAVKRINPKSDPEALGEVEREVEILSSVRHPNLIGLMGHSFDEEDGLLHVALEHCENGSLFETLHGAINYETRTYSRGGKAVELSARTRLRVARQVGGALSALHDHGIVHRDVSAGNILLTGANDARLIDMGLATRTEEGKRVKYAGTPIYSAPECSEHNALLSASSDVFSLGVVMWELVTGHVPWEDLAFHDAMEMHRTGKRLPIMDAAWSAKSFAQMPAGLPDLLEACWAQKQHMRPTAADASNELLSMELDCPTDEAALQQAMADQQRQVARLQARVHDLEMEREQLPSKKDKQRAARVLSELGLGLDDLREGGGMQFGSGPQ